MPLTKMPPGIPPSCAADFQRLLAFPLDTPQRMTEALDRYLISVREAVERYPKVNVELAEAIAGQLSRLLAYSPANTPEVQQRWVQAAARYFFLSDDGAHDWESEDGFRDDAQVVAAVDQALEDWLDDQEQPW